ncbi:MAG: hypothetical protein Q7K47_08680 [Fusobacterium sp. JB019]|nr:hypothetical protein [Fusobacterium sp. JB019]
MNHSFNINLAVEYGVYEAILIENMAFWIKRNMLNNKNYKEGNYWTYNSYKAFSNLFPYMSMRKIQRALLKLEELNVIKSGSFNKLSYDRTKWYTIVSSKIKSIYGIFTNDKSNVPKCKMHDTKMSNGVSQNVKPIPDINTNIKTDIKTTTNGGGSLDPRQKEVKEIEEKLSLSNLELSTCKNIMKIVIDKRISFERFTKVLEYTKSHIKSAGFMVSALRDNYTINDNNFKGNGPKQRSEIIDEEIKLSRKKMDKQEQEKEKDLQDRKALDDYFKFLPKEEQVKIMDKARAIAKKNYGCVWEVMCRVKVKYDILRDKKRRQYKNISIF